MLNQIKNMIKTERCIIRPLEEKDFDVLIDMYQEPDSNKYVGPLRDKTIDFYRSFLENKKFLNNEELGFFSVSTKDSKEIIGTVNVNVFMLLKLPQVGIHLRRKYWRQGYASELMAALLDYAKTEKNWDTIYGIFDTDNQASKSLMKKFDFEPKEQTDIQGVSLEIYFKSLKTL